MKYNPNKISHILSWLFFPPCPPSPRGPPPRPHCQAQPRWWGTRPARPIIVAIVEGMSSSFSSIISKCGATNTRGSRRALLHQARSPPLSKSNYSFDMTSLHYKTNEKKIDKRQMKRWKDILDKPWRSALRISRVEHAVYPTLSPVMEYWNPCVIWN